MKQFLLSVIAVVAWASSVDAQQSANHDLADFLFSVSEIGGEEWDVSYAIDTRTIKIRSHGKIKGTDYSGGLPADNLADYPITISFRITSEPNADRIQSLELLTQKKSELVDRMSENVLGWSGYSKLRPRSLSKQEWAEYLKYAELEHQVELLALPTHTFRSLYLLDVSHWHIRPAPDQSDGSKKILAQRDEVLKLVTQIKRVPNAPRSAR